jgi:hypothetical protein
LRNEGFTSASLQYLIDEQQSAIELQRIQSYVAWPLHCRTAALQDRLQDDFLKFADILELPAPDDFVGPKREYLDSNPIPNRYYWFRSLTAMRRKMNSEIHARVVLGGKLHGFIGRYPGVVEEVLFAVTTRTPLYICGGFGGAAWALAQLFQGKTVPGLELSSQYADEQYAASASYYETAISSKLRDELCRATPYDRFVGYSVDWGLLCEVFREVGVGGLNNGLSGRENEILFETPSLDEIRALVLSGLARLFGASREHVSTCGEMETSPDLAFTRAIRGAGLPRSPLIELQGVALFPADELLSLEGELFAVLGNGYLDVRRSVLPQCAPAILEQFGSISNARSLLSLDLAALNWIPARGGTSVIADFLAEAYMAHPAIAEREAVRKHLSLTLGTSAVAEAQTGGGASSLRRRALDYEQLNGPQSKILRLTILSAFVDATSVDMFLDSELKKPALAVFAGGANTEQQIFNMIRVARAEGWTGDLIAALQSNRPQNPLVRNLPDALRLATMDAPPARSKSGLTLEKIVSNGGFADLRFWAEKMVAIGQALCRIEFPTALGTGYGTGFLVSSDSVLTNYHVVENHIKGKLDPATISCRFDYARDAKGLDEGRLVGLAAGSSWIIAQSPYDPADVSGVGSAAADHLDFALLRLSEAAADHDVGGGARRGTVAVGQLPPVPTEKAPIFIVQHPKGTPMALSIGIVQGVSENGARIRYDADTLNGSSGSCVFDQRLDLVALHHSGDPCAALRAQYNEGIPMRGIVAMLETKGVSPFCR